ncbi:hypothetical protein UFOVP820_10 [uncultured Caudovirales phage]|uniref:Uncharacterized protein n=1 Tax=uncultured Caudovirales phage TaxID=2100421 RepID=A0A6J5P7Q9_9CAUD|nr:hypothetical protein UFOVP820_10 [uncultured Caudovirales phage]
MKPKSIATQIAEHFGWDVADILDYRYQPSHWSRAVYCGFDGNNYWSAGRTPPKDREGDNMLEWVRVPSRYPGNTDLWKGIIKE